MHDKPAQLRHVLTSVTFATAVVLGCTRLPAEDWPRFRGPTGEGISAEANPPTHWSETQNLVWKADVPGEGWSSPIVWGERVFVTTATEQGHSCRVISLDRASGKVLWNVEVFQQTPTRKEGKNSYATPTPVTDGQNVYAVFGEGGMAAVTFAGKVLWTNVEYPFYSRHGLGASPILYRDSLILPHDASQRVDGQAPGADEKLGWLKPWDQGFVIALDKQTGKTKWKAARGVPTRIGHVTPLVITVDGEEQLISPAGDYVEAFEPNSGKPLWWIYNKGETAVPSVIFGDGLLFMNCGFDDPAIRAFRPGGKGERGDLTATHIAWQYKKAVPMMPSFLFTDHLLFTISEHGIAMCLEADSGKPVWQHRVEGEYSASPILAAGKIYLLNEAGKTTIIEAGREFKVVAESGIGEKCQASPALSNGQLFIRSDQHLFCIAEKR